MILKETDARNHKRDISADSEAGVAVQLKPDAFILWSNFEMVFLPLKSMGIVIVSKLLVYNPFSAFSFYIIYKHLKTTNVAVS